MNSGLKNAIFRQSLVSQFTVVSLIIMVLGALGIGWWVGDQIRVGVINETASTTALYMDSFISPNLQELNTSFVLSPEHIDNLETLLGKTDLGRQIVAFKVWRQDGLIIFSTTPSLIGQVFTDEDEVKEAYKGHLVATITDLEANENVEERKYHSQLLQIYSPIRLTGSDKIIAVAEFYQKVDSLNQAIIFAQQRSWLIVSTGMLLIYLALVGFVQRTGHTIRQQQARLTAQVTTLTDLNRQNSELSERVRRAAANAAALNENFLRRISAELHDGPSQELALALMRVDRMLSQAEQTETTGGEDSLTSQLASHQSSLQHINQEVRTIAAGLSLPQLENLSYPECLARAVRAHERRTGTKVEYLPGALPDDANLSVKITSYRVIQESLNNAYRHANSLGQRVTASLQSGHLQIEISDQGPGFDTSQPIDWETHLGLAGMRERVESLGGTFSIKSALGQGTIVSALFPLSLQGENSHG